jgi:hypothetical protein
MIVAPAKFPYFGTSFDAKTAKKDGLVPSGAACHSPSCSDKLLPFRNLVSTGARLFSIQMRQTEFLSYFRISERNLSL